jgi:hypothetical protein
MSPCDPHPRSCRRGTQSVLFPAGFLLCMLAALPAGATTFTWNNAGGGSWSDASSWTPNGVPNTSGDVAVLPDLGGAYSVSVDLDPAIGELDVRSGSSLDLGSHSLGSVGQVYNAGTILNFRGLYNSAKLHNQAGGTIQAGASDSIVVSGSVTNDGTIDIGSSLQNALYLAAYTTFTGSGRVVMSGHARVNCPLARPQHNIWLKNDAGHTIAGSGDFWVPLENHGTLRQDGLTGGLLTLHCYLYNYGTIRVNDGASINVDCPLVKSFGGRIVGHNGTFTVMLPYAVGGSIDNLNGGSFVADDGDLNIGCGVIANGSIERTGSAGAVTIVSVATPSYLVVQPGAELAVGPGGLMDVGVNGSTIENHGTIRVVGTLNFDGNFVDNINIALTGDGALVLDGGNLGSPGGSILTNSAGHTITGCGTITANIINQGVIDVNGQGCAMNVTGGTITNYNKIEVLGGNLFLNGNMIVNRGTISGGGGRITMQGGATINNYSGKINAGLYSIYFDRKAPGSTVMGGTLTSSDNGIFGTLGTLKLQGVTIGPGATLKTFNRATTNVVGSTVTNHGTNMIESGGSFVADASSDYVQTDGVTLLHGGTLTVPRGIQLQGALSGTGTVVGSLTNKGEVSLDASSPGITIQGDYSQLSAGRLSFGIAGPAAAQYGHLNVTGKATLGGTVAVSATSGFVPTIGQDFKVMAFSSLTGQIAQMESNAGPPMAPLYGIADLTLKAVPSLVKPRPLPLGDDSRLPAVVRFYSRNGGFGLDLPQDADVTVRAFDVAGREVATFANERRPAGTYQFDLRGAGAAVPSGIYFARATLRMSDRSEVRTARVAFLR